MSKTIVSTRQNDVFDIIKSAVNKTADLIRPTYGPAGNKVIINKVTHKLTVDDGVQIARDLEFPDEAENAVLHIVREAAIRTNDRVGDGTTGAIIMLQAIINEVAKLGYRDGRKIARELNKGFEEVKQQLQDSSRPIKTKEELKKVARISFDDAQIAEIIADTCFKIGKDGIITLDRSSTMETYAEIEDGVTISNGYISPYMMTNPSKMETVLEDPYILFTDYRLTETNDVLLLMNKLLGQGKQNLVVVAENVEQDALTTMVTNLRHVINPQTNKPGVLSSVAVVAPRGDNRLVQLEDMAMMTGGRVLSSSKGDKLENATIEDLGRAEKFIAKRDSSIIIGPKGTKSTINKAVSELKMTWEFEKDERAKKQIEERIARFSNKVAVIKVGGATENEYKALKFKVEDAVNATQVAFNGGVVCGAGLALARIVTTSPLLNEALKYPHKQLKDNMGIEGNRELGHSEAINAVTGRSGDFMEIGVIDPVDVLVAQVESAVSIANLLVTTSGMICESPKHNKDE